MVAFIVDYSIDSTIRRIDSVRQLLLVGLLYIAILGLALSPMPHVERSEEKPYYSLEGLNATSRFERVVLNQRMKNHSLTYIYFEQPRSIDVRVSFDDVLKVVTGSGEWKFPVTHYGSGNHTLLLVGNSHAEMIVKELKSEWEAYYSTLNIFAIAGKLAPVSAASKAGTRPCMGGGVSDVWTPLLQAVSLWRCLWIMAVGLLLSSMSTSARIMRRQWLDSSKT